MNSALYYSWLDHRPRFSPSGRLAFRTLTDAEADAARGFFWSRAGERFWTSWPTAQRHGLTSKRPRRRELRAA